MFVAAVRNFSDHFNARLQLKALSQPRTD